MLTVRIEFTNLNNNLKMIRLLKGRIFFYNYRMPELGKNKAKEKAKHQKEISKVSKANETTIVSAYSEEGQERIKADKKRKKVILIVWISIYAVLLAGLAVGLYLIYR